MFIKYCVGPSGGYKGKQIRQTVSSFKLFSPSGEDPKENKLYQLDEPSALCDIEAARRAAGLRRGFLSQTGSVGCAEHLPRNTLALENPGNPRGLM